MKALSIAWKDTLTRFRDLKALIGLLGAPLIISALIGLAFGNISFDSSEPALSHIPVILVNQDDGQLGQAYQDVLTSGEVGELLAVSQMDDLTAARAEIEAGNARSVVYIPAGFSDALIAGIEQEQAPAGSGVVQVYTDPTSSVAPLIVNSIVEQISADANTVLLAGEVSAAQAAGYAQVLGPSLAQLATILPQELNQANFDFGSNRIALQTSQVGEAEPVFNAFAYFVPGMAVFFLLFSMFDGARSILEEETDGTLARLMSTPTPTSQIILGKMGGTFLTGILQFFILMLSAQLIFGLSWGNSIPGLVTIVVLTVFAASGLGAFLTAFTKNQLQAGVIGSAVSLVFGALGGSFFPAQFFTGAIDVASRFTLNRWALDGLTILTVEGGSFSDVLLHAGILAAIGMVTYVLAILAFQRRFVK